MFKKLILNYYEDGKKVMTTTLSYTESTLKRLTLRDGGTLISFNGGEFILQGYENKKIDDLYEYIHTFFYSKIDLREAITINLFTEHKYIVNWNRVETKI